MNRLNYSNASWNCFEFHIVQIGNMLLNRAMLSDWAIGPDWMHIVSKQLEPIRLMNAMRSTFETVDKHENAV